MVVKNTALRVAFWLCILILPLTDSVNLSNVVTFSASVSSSVKWAYEWHVHSTGLSSGADELRDQSTESEHKVSTNWYCY